MDQIKNLHTILDNIKKGDISPFYLIYGEEEYLMKEALNKIINSILPGGGNELNLMWIDGENENLEAMCEAMLTPPLIPGRKLVVVKNTKLCHSKSSASTLIKEINNNIESNAQRAIKAFETFLGIVGWSLDDLRDGGWETISDDDWRRAAGDEGGANREEWFPQVLALCENHDIKDSYSITNTDQLERIIKNGLPESNCFIATAACVDKRKKLFKILSDFGEVISFPNIKNVRNQRNLLGDTIKESLSNEGKRITKEAFLSLAEKTNFGLREARTELEKLVTYVGERTVIGVDDIDIVKDNLKEDTVFKLTAALAEKNIKKVLSTYRNLLDHGNHYLMIFAMITREIRFYLQGKLLLESGKITSFYPEMDYRKFQNNIYPQIKKLEKQWGKKNGLFVSQHPYVLYNILKNSNRFSVDKLIRFLHRIADIDVALKTSATNPTRTLERFLIDVCR